LSRGSLLRPTQACGPFERAISLDPTFAAAYAALGWAYWLDWVFQWDVNPRTMERAFALAQQAIALDDALPTSHRLLSDVYLWNKQHDQAIAAAERAIALDPNDAESYATLAQILGYAGRPEDAIGIVQKAMRLNPHYPAAYLTDLYDFVMNQVH
jgi:adenylate cyclase